VEVGGDGDAEAAQRVPTQAAQHALEELADDSLGPAVARLVEEEARVLAHLDQAEACALEPLHVVLGQLVPALAEAAEGRLQQQLELLNEVDVGARVAGQQA